MDNLSSGHTLRFLGRRVFREQPPLWSLALPSRTVLPERPISTRPSTRPPIQYQSQELSVSLNPQVIALAAAESLRMIHLFGFPGRHDKGARRRRAPHVRILVHAFPQEPRTR